MTVTVTKETNVDMSWARAVCDVFVVRWSHVEIEALAPVGSKNKKECIKLDVIIRS